MVTLLILYECTSGCENVVLFWSDRSKTWEPPRIKTANDDSNLNSPAKLILYPCLNYGFPTCTLTWEKGVA
ncbi:hypothetical protein VB735_05655 [Halotia wernerae UHCC 0503]|nr:hypothetical protein [Halotia wernerae UHCC 0503]